jgi:hypothetical protein
MAPSRCARLTVASGQNDREEGFVAFVANKVAKRVLLVTQFDQNASYKVAGDGKEQIDASPTEGGNVKSVVGTGREWTRKTNEGRPVPLCAAWSDRAWPSIDWGTCHN